MKRSIKSLLATLVVSLSLATPVLAGSFEDGLEAANRKDYTTALRLWHPLAEQGYAEAQNGLGAMFGLGRGVLQDYVEAHKWFNLAAVTGHGNAIINRKVVTSKMTPAQIAEAQQLAREWKPKK